jgi:hypothetical protein
MKKLIILFIIFLINIGIVIAGNNEDVPTTVGIGTTNLVAYWTYDDSSFTADYGGYTKQASSATNVSGCQINGCIYFDGVNDYVNYSKSFLPAKPWTFAWWGKADDTSNVGYMWGDSNGASAYTFARFNTGLGTGNAGFDGGTENASGTYGWANKPVTHNLTLEGLAANTWVFYVATVNSTGMTRTYTNGANEKIDTVATSAAWQKQLMLGNREDLARDFAGRVDELAIFNTNLASATITTYYNDQLKKVRPYSNLSTPKTLAVPSLTNSSIYITWVNPTDSVFNHTGLYYNTSTSSALVFISNETGTSKNITGLTNNTIYSIYIYSYAHNNKNTTVGAFIINTTSNNTRSPSIDYSQNSTNSTVAGTSISHNLYWNTTGTLDSFVFQFCNGTWNIDTSTCGSAGSNNLTILNDTYIEVDDDVYGAANAVLCYVDDPVDGGASYGDCAQRWNLSSIPSSATITDVQMCFTHERSDNIDDSDIISFWGIVNSTWATASTTFHASPYINFKNMTGAQMGAFAVGTRMCFNVTTWFAQQFTGGNYSISFNLYLENDTDDTADDFFAMDSKEAVIVANRPSLNVTYTIPGTGGWVNDTPVKFNYNTYQENANETTLSGNATDGDWGTGAQYVGDFDINYTKPAGAISAILQIKDDGGYTNISLSNSCFNKFSDKLYLRYAYDGGDHLKWWCGPGFNESDILLNDVMNIILYEEAIYWQYNTNWSNVSKTISSTVGLNYSWCFYANTTSGSTNNSCANPFVYISTGGVATLSCSYNTGITKIQYRIKTYNPYPQYVNATGTNSTISLLICNNTGTASGTFQVKVNDTNVNVTDYCSNTTNPSLVLTASYQTISAIAAGSFSNVWCARNLSQEPAALKRMQYIFQLI